MNYINNLKEKKTNEEKKKHSKSIGIKFTICFYSILGFQYTHTHTTF